MRKARTADSPPAACSLTRPAPKVASMHLVAAAMSPLSSRFPRSPAGDRGSWMDGIGFTGPALALSGAAFADDAPRTIISRVGSSAEAILAADAVVGITSMLLVEAAALDRPSVSLIDFDPQAAARGA